MIAMTIVIRRRSVIIMRIIVIMSSNVEKQRKIYWTSSYETASDVFLSAMLISADWSRVCLWSFMTYIFMKSTVIGDD